MRSSGTDERVIQGFDCSVNEYDGEIFMMDQRTFFRWTCIYIFIRIIKFSFISAGTHIVAAPMNGINSVVHRI